MIPALIAATFLAPAEPAFDAQKLEAAVTKLRKNVHEGKIPGAVVLVLQNGKPVLDRAVGYSELESKTLLKTNSLFQVMSMTKPVTAAAAMVAVEKGLFSLDDPIEQYLPNFKGIQVKDSEGNLAKAAKAPTIRQLMMHTSGLASDDPGGISDEEKAAMTLAEYAERLGTEPLTSQPGSTIRYSGVGFSTLAAIIEKTSGTPFDQFVEAEIFRPLGMRDTTFFWPKGIDGNRLAQTYMTDQGKFVPLPGDRFRAGAKFANGAGGLYSTSADMAKFIESFRTGAPKRFLSPASIALMTSVQTGNLLSDGNDARGFGLGWSVVRNPGGQTTLRNIGSFGHTGAFGTEYWHDPKTGVTLVFMAQTFFVPEDARKQFSTMVNAALR